MISDIHFNLNNLDSASVALLHSINTAAQLKVPLIIAGDLQDTKDIIRGKVANRIIDILENSPVKPYILVGNHDLLNEKGEQHALNYLKPYAHIIDTPTDGEIGLLPYYNDSVNLKRGLSVLTDAKIVFMHQGVKGAFMGDYIQDKTSIDPEELKHLTVISGHYHRHQTIGTVTYIGSPFTHTFGEANDGEKGYLIVNQDGSFDRVILDIRKHIKLEYSLEALPEFILTRPDDIIWLTIKGYKSELDKINKNYLGKKLFGHSNYKLQFEILKNDVTNKPKKVFNNDHERLDAIIESKNETIEQKHILKALWRSIV